MKRMIIMNEKEFKKYKKFVYGFGITHPLGLLILINKHDLKITKQEYIEIVSYVYKNEIPDEVNQEIEYSWKEIKKILIELNILIKYDENEIEIKDW
jgi:hypothetical protein